MRASTELSANSPFQAPAKRTLRLIKLWAKQHAAELRVNWQRAKAGKALETIEPLR
jgi:hypothetical protein